MAQTAMQQMYDELMQHEYTIPLDLIVRCKELIKMEKEQIMDAYCKGDDNIGAEQYYKETYKK